MKAVILAAGIASRLRPLTDTTPKCLLKVGERCLLQRAFDALLQNGFREFVIVTGYRQQQIVNFLEAHYPALEVTFIYNEKYASTNNIYSLWLTRPYVDKEDILLLDSDILFDPQIVAKLLGYGQADALALNHHTLGEEEIKVIADNDGKVLEISKTCSISRAIGESIGIEKMSAAYTEALFRELEVMITKEGLDNIFYERAFERLIPQGHSFYALDTTEYFSVELDTVNDFEQAQRLIPPNIVHRDIWDLVGGYSIEYSPGMYSDPDFTAKLYMCGVRFMKGLQASRIYHFETKSTTRIRKNCGQMQFLLKWGMTSSTFRKVFTYKGKDFKSQKIGTFKTGNRFKISLIRGRLKAIFYLLTKDFGPLWKFWKKTFV
jgi:choline kinase